MNIVARTFSSFRLLATVCQRRMSFLSLLDRPKKPEELSPVFKLPQRLKGHSRSKIVSKTKSRKMRGWCRIMKPRLHNHNGLMKRIRIVGPRYARKFKFTSAHKRHLLRNKSKSNLRRKMRARYIHKADEERVRKLIPNYKNQKFKFLH